MKSLLRIALLSVLATAGLTGCVNDTPQTAGRKAVNMIMTRASVRDFNDRAVSADTVETLLRAAMSAPSAMNRQPWRIVVVQDKALLTSLAEASPNAPYVGKAPVAFVVCGVTPVESADDPIGRMWVQDCSAASENLLLAAHFMGLGGVWTGVYPDSTRIATLRRILSLPDTLTPLNLIPVGYPDKAAEPKDKWAPDKIIWK